MGCFLIFGRVTVIGSRNICLVVGWLLGLGFGLRFCLKTLWEFGSDQFLSVCSRPECLV